MALSKKMTDNFLFLLMLHSLRSKQKYARLCVICVRFKMLKGEWEMSHV